MTSPRNAVSCTASPATPVNVLTMSAVNCLSAFGLSSWGRSARFLRGRLGHYKIPRIVKFSDDPLPKTGTGKIRKIVLREEFWAGKEKRVQG